ASMLSTALYPTLSRLHAEGGVRYAELVHSVLRATVLFGMLFAAGTFLFANEIVGLVYGLDHFAPAVGTLKVLAGYLVLVFVDITLSVAVIAANAQTPWIVAKMVSVLLAVGLNIVLVPICHAAFGNGGIGIAASTVTT